MTNSLDDLAAFLMHRSVEVALSDKERLSIYALVAAYREDDDPPRVAAGLRAAAFRFADRKDYRTEWRPRSDEQVTPLAEPFAVTLDGLADSNFPATDGSPTAHHFIASRVHHQILDAGHNLPQEAPHAFSDAVLEVLQLRSATDKCGRTR